MCVGEERALEGYVGNNPRSVPTTSIIVAEQCVDHVHIWRCGANECICFVINMPHTAAKTRGENQSVCFENRVYHKYAQKPQA